MRRQWTFSVARTSWGIFVDLRAEAVEGRLEDSVLVAPNLFLRAVDAGWTRLTGVEGDELKRGLRIVAPQIREKRGDGALTVRITEIKFSDCDFQPEGLACAMMNWAAETFDFEAPDVPIDFDKAANRYIFHFPEV